MLATDLRLALDPVAFARSLGFSPDAWQARALRWNGRRGLWNCARQSGKSTVAALLAVHRAIYRPDSLVLLVSPSLRQSSELFRKTGDWLARLPDAPGMPEDNRLSCTLANGSRIVSLPGSEDTIRGYSGAALLLIDEAARVADLLYYSVRPMLAVSGGWLLAMSTPFGKRGWWHQEWTAGGASWDRVEIKAAECPRISPEFLEEERRSLGYFYAQEYECEFRETTDQLFTFDLVQSAVTADVKPLFGVAV